MQDILSTITQLREQRGWTEYQLAEQSGLPQSTISSWYRKDMIPTIPSLEKICSVFGITLSELLSQGEDPVSLTENQRQLLQSWAILTSEQQDALLHLLDSFLSEEAASFSGGKAKDYFEIQQSCSTATASKHPGANSILPLSSLKKAAETPTFDQEEATDCSLDKSPV